MCFLRSPERDLSEVTVGANKRLVWPPDISTAISMPVKMLLALCNRIIAVHGPVMAPWCHCGSLRSQTSYHLMFSMKHGRVWRNAIMCLLFINLNILLFVTLNIPQYDRNLTALTHPRQIVGKNFFIFFFMEECFLINLILRTLITKSLIESCSWWNQMGC